MTKFIHNVVTFNLTAKPTQNRSVHQPAPASVELKTFKEHDLLMSSCPAVTIVTASCCLLASLSFASR